MYSTELRRLLPALQRAIEGARVDVHEKLHALQALSVLAGCVARGAAESPEAFVQVATLLELSDGIPAVKGLLPHYPVLTEHDASRPATGWGAL